VARLKTQWERQGLWYMNEEAEWNPFGQCWPGETLKVDLELARSHRPQACRFTPLLLCAGMKYCRQCRGPLPEKCLVRQFIDL
jgi:hypothetical protein